jgi:hypothetical protein
MIRSLNTARMILCLLALTGMALTHACQLTITNDVDSVVTLVPLNGGKATTLILQPGDVDQTYGAPHEQAHFKIIMNDACIREVEQYACGTQPSDTQLTMSRLLNAVIDAQLSKMFTFKKCSE